MHTYLALVVTSTWLHHCIMYFNVQASFVYKSRFIRKTCLQWIQLYSLAHVAHMFPLCRGAKVGRFAAEWSSGEPRALELLRHIPHVIPHRKVSDVYRNAHGTAWLAVQACTCHVCVNSDIVHVHIWYVRTCTYLVYVSRIEIRKKKYEDCKS